MNGREFVKVIRVVVEAAAAKDVVGAFEKPPGRKPDEKLIMLSKWFMQLKSEDREMVASAIAMTAEQATYNILLVLDGRLAIESTEEKGCLELVYQSKNGRALLNDPEAEDLTSIFKDIQTT